METLSTAGRAKRLGRGSRDAWEWEGSGFGVYEVRSQEILSIAPQLAKLSLSKMPCPGLMKSPPPTGKGEGRKSTTRAWTKIETAPGRVVLGKQPRHQPSLA